MARQYSAKTFLRNTPNDLLKQYFTERGINLGFNWSLRHNTDVNPVFVALEQLPVETRSRVDGDFAVINDLACESGVLAIINKAGGRVRGVGDRFAKMRNAYERAFWTFLHEPELFRLAGCFHEMDRRLGWRRRFVGVRLDTVTDDAGLRAFEQALRMLYRRQGRGRFCHVDHYLRHDPLRHCYFAYPEDYASTDMGYDERGRFQQRARRSAFELIFVYRPEEGMLELRARGERAEIAELETIFCTRILGLRQLPDESGRVPYNLAVLKDRHFTFTTDPQDHVEAVQVRELGFKLPGDYPRGLVLYAKPRHCAPLALHDLLDRAIDESKLPLHELHPERAKLRMIFGPEHDARPRSLTFEITYPDRCTLRDEPRDQICRKYLRKWGIACA
jgi:hypothetical protein